MFDWQTRMKAGSGAVARNKNDGSIRYLKKILIGEKEVSDPKIHKKIAQKENHEGV